MFAVHALILEPDHLGWDLSRPIDGLNLRCMVQGYESRFTPHFYLSEFMRGILIVLKPFPDLIEVCLIAKITLCGELVAHLLGDVHRDSNIVNHALCGSI